MKNLKGIVLLIVLGITYSGMVLAQETQSNKNTKDTTAQVHAILNTYVIERDVPGAGSLTAKDLQEISLTSCNVLNKMDQNEIQWLHSYVTENKIFCVYRAKNEEIIKEHAKKGKFACNSINLLSTRIDPGTAITQK